MSDRFSIFFLCLLIALVAAMPASAQEAPQVPGTVAAPSPQEAQEPQPEPPKVVLNVEVKADLLTVELSNVDFGPAIRAVADKAGFTIEGTGEVFNRKLNTKFTDIEVERGVLRLLTLVKENNYMLHYDTRGLISKLEIFGIDSSKPPSTAAAKQPARPAPAPRPAPAVSPQTQQPATVAPAPRQRLMPPVSRRRPAPSQPKPPSPSAAEPSDAVKPEPTEENSEEEATVKEIPYVAPQPRFSPAPAKRP